MMHEVKKVATQNPKYRWFVITALCFIQAVGTMVLLSPVTIIGEISKTIGTDLGETSAITMVAGSIFVIISSFFGGKMIDRVGVYIIIMGGLVLSIIGAALVPLIGSKYLGLIVVRFIQGFGAGPIFASLPLAVTQWSEKQERGMIFGIQGVIVSMGSAITVSYVPFVFQKTGSWQAAMFWMVVFYTLALVLSLIIFLGPKPYRKPSAFQSDQTGPALCADKKMLFLPSTWLLLSCSFWFAWIVRIFHDLVPSYLAMDKPVGAGIGLTKAGALMSGIHVITMVGLLSSGLILESLFRGRPKKLIMIAFCVPAVSWYFLMYQFVFSNMLILTVFMFTGGITLSFINPMVMTFVTKNFPERIMGKLGGLLTMFSHFGSLTGLAVASYSISVKGDYSIALALICLGGVLGFLSALFLREQETNLKIDVEKSSG